ncbi:MAG TPA: protein kinase [Planctomycetaceae bacterium]|jgi:serine/threonine protein kinase/Leucine-rich repeat (LRR) protein|nr:protein kinase [Planctomycetaceae bacterium]
MAAMSACPSRDELQRMVLGQLADEPAERIQQHLDRCDTCVGTLQQCVASDEFLEAVRAVRGAASDPTKTMDLPIDWMRSAVSTWIQSYDRTQTGKTALPAPEVDVRSLLSPPQSAEEIGRVADFRVLSVLGVGGMAVVFEAEDSQLKRRVALKLMRPAIAAKPGGAERFLREAQSAAALKHEHVVTIHQVGMHGQTPFIALELLRGETLETYLVRQGQLSIHDVIRIGREIALGLGAAHLRGLVHRDIKPANIWLEGSETPAPVLSVSGRESQARNPLSAAKVKILDFGCAKTWAGESGITYPGLLIGTPAYMAPEQLAGGAVDPRSDLFSLGCVLYRMAGGKAPFGGDDLISVVRALALEDPAPVLTLNRHVPPALSDLITALLSKSPDQRPPSAQAVVDRLDAIEEGLTAPRFTERTRASALPAKSAAGRRRRKTWIVSVVSGLAAMLLLAWFVFGAQLLRVVTAVPKQPEGQSTVATNNQQSQSETIGDPDRRAALWVLSRGGSVTLDDGHSSGPIDIQPGQTLPTGDFKLTKVGLENTNFNAADLEQLGALANVQELILSGTQTTDTGLGHLRGLTRLTSLTLDRTQVTDVGLAHLVGMTPLKTLSLKHTSVTDVGLQHLEGLANLESLALEGTRVSDAGLPHILRLTALNTLDLTNTSVTDAGLKQLQNLGQLESLRLNGTQVTDAGLETLVALRKLHALMLEWTPVTDAGLKQLQGLPQLDKLWLRGTRVTNAGLRHLRGLTKLRVLGLTLLPVTDAGLQELSPLTNLQHLVLDRTRVTDAGLQHLKGMKDLYSLYLGETGVTEAGLANLKDLKNLHALGLYGLTGVTDTAVPGIARLHSLQEVDLRETHLTAKRVGDLKAVLPNLRIKWCEANHDLAVAILEAGGRVDVRLAGAAAARSVKKFDDLPTELFQVTRAHLAGSRQKLNELLRALLNPRLDALVSLDLSGTPIDDTDLERLKPLVALQELNLANTNVTDAGLAHLKDLRALRRVVLDGDAIRGSGLVHLQELPELTELRLGCPTLADLFLVDLAGLKKLKRLSLAESRLSEEGAKGLAHLPHLEELDLTNAQVTVARVAELKTLLPRCRIISTPGARQVAEP